MQDEKELIYSEFDLTRYQIVAGVNAQKTMKNELMAALVELAGRHFIAGDEGKARMVKEVARVINEYPIKGK